MNFDVFTFLYRVEDEKEAATEENNEPGSNEDSSSAYPDTEVVVVPQSDKLVFDFQFQLSRNRNFSNSTLRSSRNQYSIEVKMPTSEKPIKKEERKSVSSEHDEDYVIYLGDDKPIVIKPKEPKKGDKKVTFSRQTSEKGIYKSWQNIRKYSYYFHLFYRRKKGNRQSRTERK